MNELEKKKQKLEADIVLLERKHNQLLSSLEANNLAHSNQTTFFKKEITILEKEKTKLDQEILNLTKIYTELTKKGESLRSSMQDFEEKELNRIETLATKLYSDAVLVLEAANIKQAQLDESRRLLDEQSIGIQSRDEESLKQQLINEKRKKELDTEAQNSQIALSQARQALKNLIDQKQEIERKIDASQGELEKLTKSVTTKQGELGELINNVITIKSDMTLREIKLKAREDKVLKREIAARQKELWVADREKTVGRSYKELISKGGRIING